MKENLVVKVIDSAMYNNTTYFEIAIGKRLRLSIITSGFLRLTINGEYLLLKNCDSL